MNIFQNLLPKSLDFPRPNPTSRHSCAVSWRSWKGPPRCVAAPERNVRRSLGRRSTLSPWTLRLSPTWRKRTYPNDPMYLFMASGWKVSPFNPTLQIIRYWHATKGGDQMPCRRAVPTCGWSQECPTRNSQESLEWCLWQTRQTLPNVEPNDLKIHIGSGESNEHVPKYASGRIPKQAQAHRLVYVGFLFLNGKR